MVKSTSSSCFWFFLEWHRKQFLLWYPLVGLPRYSHFCFLSNGQSAIGFQFSTNLPLWAQLLKWLWFYKKLTAVIFEVYSLKALYIICEINKLVEIHCNPSHFITVAQFDYFSCCWMFCCLFCSFGNGSWFCSWHDDLISQVTSFKERAVAK